MPAHRLAWPFVCGLLIAFAAGNVSAYDGFTQVGETGERIVAFVREANEKAGFRGAVLAADSGKVIAAVAVGPISGRSDEPMRVDTLFEIASCTKPFTAIAVMKLAEEGRLALDDSIAEQLPGVPDDCRAITVRHLLQHTSGIPRTNSRGAGTDLAKVLPTFLEGGPRTTPGSKHAYWNQGYSLLSEVIARASRKTYTQYLREAVFKPSGMKNTRFTGQRPPAKASVAIGESTRGAARSALDHPYGEYGFQYRGMGGVVTNLIDLWKWDRALAEGKLLTPESLKEMTRPGQAGYALGWRITKLSPDEVVHGHTGSVRGFLASVQRNPTKDGCLFVLAASDASAPFDLVSRGCQDLLRGKKPPAIPDATKDRRLPPALLKELAGTYRDGQGRTLTVSRQGKLARAEIDWHGPRSRGYLGAEGKDGLAFAVMATYDPLGFAGADKMKIQRKSGEVTALTLTIAQIGKSIDFDRVGD